MRSLKPTSDDFEPRKDGWFEHRGIWDEVVVGTVLANRERRSERWEVIDVAHGKQVEYGYTLWMRIREQTTGTEVTVKPHNKTYPVTILTLDPRDTDTTDPTEPSDTEAIMLVVRELGAELMATRDEKTGEVTCPDYAAGHHHLGTDMKLLGRAEVEHMKFAHGLEVPDDISVKELTTLHGRSHNPKFPDIGKGGFPHRHVPEDLTIFTGMRS